MDGCTMGQDSYLASTLVGKILRKIVKERDYKELHGIESACTDIDLYLKSILRELFKQLNITRNQLMLGNKELLTTLILLILNKKASQGIAMIIGDGLININGSMTEFDQDNKPDYLGFHLDEDFDGWYNAQTQKVIFDNIKDISIATDGIFTFLPFKEIIKAETINPIDFLLLDSSKSDSEDMLQLKLKALEHQYGLKPTDDLALIRVIEAQ